MFQSLVTVNAQKKDANVIYERQNASDILAQRIKKIKVCTIQSTISNSTHSNYNEQVDAINNYEELVDTVSDPKSDPSSNTKVATYTTNVTFTKKI